MGHPELGYRETDDQQNAQTKRQIVRHGSKPWGEARAATEWSLNSFHGRLVAPECQANGPIPARRSVQPIQPDSCWPAKAPSANFAGRFSWRLGSIIRNPSSQSATATQSIA